MHIVLKVISVSICLLDTNFQCPKKEVFGGVASPLDFKLRGPGSNLVNRLSMSFYIPLTSILLLGKLNDDGFKLLPFRLLIAAS